MRQPRCSRTPEPGDDYLPNERACRVRVRWRRAAVAVRVQADHVLGVQVDALDHVLPAQTKRSVRRTGKDRLETHNLSTLRPRHFSITPPGGPSCESCMTCVSEMLRSLLNWFSRLAAPSLRAPFGQMDSLPHPHGIRIMSAKTSEPISTGSADSMRTDLRFSPGPSFDLLSTRCGPRAFHQHLGSCPDYSCLQSMRCRTNVAEFSSAEMRPACSASSRLT